MSNNKQSSLLGLAYGSDEEDDDINNNDKHQIEEQPTHIEEKPLDQRSNETPLNTEEKDKSSGIEATIIPIQDNLHTNGKDLENNPVIEGSLREEENEGESVTTQNSSDVQWSKLVYDIQFPKEPDSVAEDPEFQKHLQDLFVKNAKVSLNLSLKNLKSFRNPNIYTKLVELFSIREFGSNYPPEEFDLYSLPEEGFYDELAKAQRKWHDQREKERAKRTEINFVQAKNSPMGASATTTTTTTLTSGTTTSTLNDPAITNAIQAVIQAATANNLNHLNNQKDASSQQNLGDASSKRKSKWDSQTQIPKSNVQDPPISENKKQKTS